MDCGNTIIEEYSGGLSFYASLSVTSSQECIDACIENDLCTEISFTTLVDGNRCLLYRAGGLKITKDVNSFIWSKQCQTGLCN